MSNRRQSDRVDVEVPIEIIGADLLGTQFFKQGVASVISRNGAGCTSPKLCSALKSRAYSWSFPRCYMVDVSHVSNPKALPRYHRSYLLRSSTARSRKSSAPTTTRSIQASASPTKTQIARQSFLGCGSAGLVRLEAVSPHGASRNRCSVAPSWI